MSEYAVMPKADYQDACDAIREKTGGTELIKSGEMGEQIRGIQSGGGDFTITDASYLFYEGARVDAIEELLARCKGVKNAFRMFYSISSGLSTVDLSDFNTSLITDMDYMFYDSYCIAGIYGLENFNTENTTKMSYMFGGTHITTLNVSSFKTSKVTSLAGFIYGCTQLKEVIGFENFDTSNVTSMASMCEKCFRLKNINFSGFDTAKVTSFSKIFSSCEAMESIIGFSATNKAGITIGFPQGTSSSPYALKRLTFKDCGDTPAIRSAIKIPFCSFEYSGLEELASTLSDVSALGLSSTYTTITITGNPVVTGKLKDGTACQVIDDTLRAKFTAKGWTLVE